MSNPTTLAQNEAAFRAAEEALRRGDPDTLAGRMPEEWCEKERVRWAEFVKAEKPMKKQEG